MKLFTCTDHDCFYPVGVASIVVAKDRRQARGLLDKELIKRNLEPGGYTLVEIDTTIPQAVILRDGDY